MLTCVKRVTIIRQLRQLILGILLKNGEQTIRNFQENIKINQPVILPMRFEVQLENSQIQLAVEISDSPFVLLLDEQ